MSAKSQDDQDTYSGDRIADPANDTKVRRLLWDILTLPDEMYNPFDG